MPKRLYLNIACRKADKAFASKPHRRQLGLGLIASTHLENHDMGEGIRTCPISSIHGQDCKEDDRHVRSAFVWIFDICASCDEDEISADYSVYSYLAKSNADNVTVSYRQV